MANRMAESMQPQLSSGDGGCGLCGWWVVPGTGIRTQPLGAWRVPGFCGDARFGLPLWDPFLLSTSDLKTMLCHRNTLFQEKLLIKMPQVSQHAHVACAVRGRNILRQT